LHTDLAPEDELCLLLCRGQISPEVHARVRALLASPVPWPLVLKRAYAYAVTPLLYVSLRELGFPDVPEAVQAELKSSFWNNALQNTQMAEELIRVLRVLGGAGVPAIPLKGMALADALYPDPAVRPCADTDVLVPPHRAIEAYHLLVASGYQSDLTDPRLLRLAVRYGKHYVLTRQDGASTHTLEVHCGLVWGGPLEREILEEVWSNATRQEFHGVPAFALSPEWEFLYLAVHAAQHGGLSLKWYLDLDRLCCRGMIDWRKAQAKANSLGWEAEVQSSLAVCRALFDTPIDPVWGPKPPPRRRPVPQVSDFQLPSENLF